MYCKQDSEQLFLEDFFLPFGGKLRADNRWVKLAALMPWDHIDEIYAQSMSMVTGRHGIPSRIAFGAIFIKEMENLTDVGCVHYIQENPYAQYFLGLKQFQEDPLFDASMMVHFRKRFPVNEISRINEYVCTGKWPEESRNVDRNGSSEENDEDDKHQDPPTPPAEKESSKGSKNPNTSKKKLKKQKKNKGKLIMDATVAPADIKFPTDIDLLNKCREHLETAIDMLWEHVSHNQHKYPYSKKKARKAYLNVSKSKRWTEKLLRTGIGVQLQCIEKAMARVTKWMQEIDAPKFPGWLNDRLEIIPQVWEQQKQMFDTHTHSCKDRIVSLQQPHVRPINRGKRPNPTEFGQKLHLSVADGYTFLEQTCWSNYNEGFDLQATVEAYYARFGYYPKAVLADKIYQTRANRKYCSELGIRLTGPALGRKTKAASVQEARQMYRDSCERNAVEGRNGNLKRRFGLDLISSKLDENAKTEAALNLVAMNAVHRLLHWYTFFWKTNFFSIKWVAVAVFQ